MINEGRGVVSFLWLAIGAKWSVDPNVPANGPILGIIGATRVKDESSTFKWKKW